MHVDGIHDPVHGSNEHLITNLAQFFVCRVSTVVTLYYLGVCEIKLPYTLLPIFSKLVDLFCKEKMTWLSKCTTAFGLILLTHAYEYRPCFRKYNMTA